MKIVKVSHSIENGAGTEGERWPDSLDENDIRDQFLEVLGHDPTKEEVDEVIRESTQRRSGSPPPEKDIPPGRFPLLVFPEELQIYIRAVASSTETPEDAIAFTVLGMLSACAGTHLKVHVKGGYETWCNDYLALVTAPSFGKSPIFKHAQEPLKQVQAELRKRAAGAHEDPETDPPKPQVMVSDVTSEALVRVQSENEGAAAMVSGETPFFARLTNVNNAQSIECFLSSYSGEYYQVDRITRKQNEVECARLAIIIATQDKALKGIHHRPELVDRGLMARFTFYMAPEISEDDFNDDDDDVDPGLSAYYSALLTDIGLQCRDKLPELRFSEAAAAYRKVWRNGFKRRHRLRSGDLHDISRHCSKLEDKVIRWAGLLHMLWGSLPDGEITSIPSDEITMEDFQRAHMLVDFDLHHYRLAMEHITGGPVYYLAAALKDRLRDSAGETVTLRDLKRTMADFRKADPEVRQQALEDLEDAKLIESVTVQSSDSGGRPSPSIKVSAWI
jgi:hypothetical protein